MIGKTSAGTSAKEEKTVTAGTAQKVVTPSNGKLLSKVTINPTPSQAKTETAVTGASKRGAGQREKRPVCVEEVSVHSSRNGNKSIFHI